ncbi:MAG: acyltransferase [Chlorobiales bacterium]|nr:acyltransferase [Chlorobiales bacterium]
MRQRLGKFIFKLFGWRVVGELPNLPKLIAIGAPHTSNWDFALMLLLSLNYNRKFYWIGKHTLFRPPFGFLMRALHGISVDRRLRQNTVEQVTEFLERQKEAILVITPEGTRKKTAYWKSGFYFIALNAKVPIALGFADYKKKVTGIGPTLMPTGDIESDLSLIRAFYANISGKYPEQAGTIAFRKKETDHDSE